MIATEELGEWALSLLQGKDDDWDNAAHVAAVMVAFMEARIYQLANGK